MSNASLCALVGGLATAISPKLVVPVSAFQPDFLFRISSACVWGLVRFEVLVGLRWVGYYALY
jgi:hypothetical protein